jgi:hypothetical protein
MSAFSTLSRVIRDCSTGIDGESYDVGRILGAVMILTFIGISVYAYVVARQAFDPVTWGTGGGGLFTGIGAHLMLKSKTEPGA